MQASAALALLVGGPRHLQPQRWPVERQRASEVRQRQPFPELEEVQQSRHTRPQWGEARRTVRQEPH